MEKIKKVFEATGNFTNEQMDNRKRRLEDPILQAKLEQMKTNIKGDIKKACSHGLEALYRFTLTAPAKAVWEGGKEFVNVIEHNFDDKKIKRAGGKKKSYFDIPGAMITEFANQYGKGTMSATKLVGNLCLALGRTTALGSRYTIGK